MSILKNELDSCSLRRTKDLLDLPEKNIIEEYVDMKDDQLLFYRNIVDGIRDQVDKVNLNTTNLLSLVIRLRQATACPSILTSENISSAKIDRAIDLVDEIIGFCKAWDISIDELHLNADCLAESIKHGSWQSCTDSCLSFDKYSQEYKDIISMKKIVSDDEYNKIVANEEPYLISM